MAEAAREGDLVTLKMMLANCIHAKDDNLKKVCMKLCTTCVLRPKIRPNSAENSASSADLDEVLPVIMILVKHLLGQKDYQGVIEILLDLVAIAQRQSDQMWLFYSQILAIFGIKWRYFWLFLPYFFDI